MEYKTTITAIGSDVADIEAEGMLIVFNETAPPELAEISILHTITELERDVQVGDQVVFGEKTYDVTAVGYEANETLRMLGHCTFIFQGNDEVELPGQICLSQGEMPVIKIGDTFGIIFR